MKTQRSVVLTVLAAGETVRAAERVGSVRSVKNDMRVKPAS
jgi:hypothetical protein